MKQRTLIELIIDRVDNVNIFNLIKEDDISVNGSFKSIVDDDLINEYIDSIEKIYKIFMAEISSKGNSHQRLDELKKIGLEFYKQIFPESLQNYFAVTKNKYLYLKPDENVSTIPWEILYDGNKFLNEKFFLGRGPKCDYSPKTKFSLAKPIKMLIIIDPTNTLTWAEFEANNLINILQSRFSHLDLSIELIASKELSKLNFLNTMSDKDIIHFIGHSVEDQQNNDNTGWLIGKNKLLRIREISNSNISPFLVFSHSCKSANNISKTFLQTGVKHFIGCRNEVLETKYVIDFSSKFYIDILSGIPIGKAFHDNIYKSNESNILSFNYVLFSNPKWIVNSFNFQIERNSYIKPEEIIMLYPYPISEAYKKFMLADKIKNHSKSFEELQSVLYQIIRFFSFIIIEELKRHNLLSNDIIHNLKNPELEDWKNFIFTGLSELINLRQSIELPQIANSFYLQKENIEKCIEWISIYKKNINFINDEPETLTVFQYLIDSLLIDLSFITKYDIIYFFDEGINNIYKIISLKGNEIKIDEKDFDEIYCKGQTIIFDPIEGLNIMDISSYIKIINNKKQFKINFANALINNQIIFEKNKFNEI